MTEGARDAGLVARLLAIDPAGLGGAILRDPSGSGLAPFVAALARLLPDGAPVKRLPSHITEDRLIGGIDLALTLAAGRRVLAPGILAEADGGVIVVPGAERLAPIAIAHLARVLDQGSVRIERDGLSIEQIARVAMIATDESRDGDEPVSPVIADRLAFSATLDGRDTEAFDTNNDSARTAVEAARRRLHAVDIADDVIEALCAAAVHLGIGSLRPPSLAVRAARAHAALAGRSSVTDEDAVVASRLVLAPRVTVPPELASQPPEPPPPPADPPDAPESPEQQADRDDPLPSLEDLVLAAALAHVPPHLLDALKSTERIRQGRGSGRRSDPRKAPDHGRPVGVRREVRRGTRRLDLVATLKAAAPWQTLRQATAHAVHDGGSDTRARLAIRRDDFHVKRLKRTPVSVAIFVVDASGSSALHRLAEAKGAVELLLRDCYVRRDEVAVIAFRGREARLELSPTRSLVRARRQLAQLPGGGGTPLASGLAAAADLAARIVRKGQTPVIVVLTDGRANISLRGDPGREQAKKDTLTVARRLQADGHAALVIDTSPRPDPQARDLADALHARYVALPYAGAEAVSTAVRQVVREAQP